MIIALRAICSSLAGGGGGGGVGKIRKCGFQNSVKVTKYLLLFPEKY